MKRLLLLVFIITFATTILVANNTDFFINHYPSSSGTKVYPNTTLKWELNEIYESNIKYDIYVGRENELSLLASNLIQNKYKGKNFKPGTTYYWKVVAKNGSNVLCESPLWKFHTVEVKEIWKVKNGLFSYVTPAVTEDGFIYSGGSNIKKITVDGSIFSGRLFKYNSDGSLIWEQNLEDYFPYGISIDNNNKTIYVSCVHGSELAEEERGKLLAFNLDGTIKWEFETGGAVWSNPAIANDGTIYVGCIDNHLYAINPDGSLKWSYNIDGVAIPGSPAIGPDGTVYIGDYLGNLYAINPTGEMIWKFDVKSDDLLNLSGEAVFYPAIDDDGTIYVGSLNGFLYAINPDGSLKWRYYTDGAIYHSPTTGKNGTIYIGNQKGYLYSIKNGSLIWKFDTNGRIASSPTVSKNGTIYISKENETLFAINKNGSLKWEFNTDSAELLTSPVIGKDETIYFQSFGGNLFAIPDNNEGLAETAWPMVFKDPLHTSRCKETYRQENLFSDIEPSNYKKTVSLNTDLIWNYKNDDKNEVVYDIYFGKDKKPTLIASNISVNELELNKLEIDTNYYWRVKAKHSSGETTLSPLWEFKTFEAGNIIWTFDVGEKLFSSPVLGYDGTVYVGSTNGYVYALSNNGNIKWKFKTNGEIGSAPAVGFDGTIYVGSEDTYLYALNPDGSLKWKFKTNGIIISTPSFGIDGKIYFDSYDDYLYALNKDGKLYWKYKLGSSSESSPIVSKEGDIYIGGNDNCLYAIDSEGKLKWKYETNYNITAPPAIYNNVIYTTSNDGYIYAINQDGTLKWKYGEGFDTPRGQDVFVVSGFTISSSLAIDSDGTIYYTKWDGKLYAVNPDGSLKWKYPEGKDRISPVLSTPAIDQEGNIYVGFSGNLSVISPDGDLKWRINTSNTVFSPIINVEGTVYFSCESGIVYAVKGENKISSSYWPMFKKSEQHTGNEIISPYYAYILVKTIPSDNETNVSTTTTLSWELLKPESKEISYDVFFGTDKTLELIRKNHRSNSIQLSDLKYDSEYYWRIIVKGKDGLVISTPVLRFTTIKPPTYPGKVKWKFDFNSTVNTPAVAKDGTVYVSSKNGYLYSINPNGKLHHRYWLRDVFRDPPSIGVDGTVYLCGGNYLYAINPENESKWKIKFDEQTITSPSIGRDGSIYVNTTDYLYTLSPDGKLKWKHKISSEPYTTSISIDYNGVIYVISKNTALHAINPDGTTKWICETGGYSSNSSPVIGKDGTIYFGVLTRNQMNPTEPIRESKLFAINPDGTVKWEYKIYEGGIYGLAIGNDETIYFNSLHSSYALDSSGKRKWKTSEYFSNIFYGELTTPTLGDNGYIYLNLVKNGESRIYSKKNKLEVLYTASGCITTNIVIDHKGIIYFIEGYDTLVSLYSHSKCYADSPWPMYKNNPLLNGCSTMKHKKPLMPENPQPENNELEVNTNIKLKWDFNVSNDASVIYDVLFGTKKEELTTLATGIEQNLFDPGKLEEINTYFWRIIARDENGKQIVGPLWSFTTESPLKSPDTLFSKCFGSRNDEIARSIYCTADGGYIIAGYSYDYSVINCTGDCILVMKFNNKDELEWKKSLDLSYTASINSIKETNDGGYIMAGYTYIIRNFAARYIERFIDRFLVIKLDKNGEFEWDRIIGNESEKGLARDVIQNNDGGYIAVGDFIAINENSSNNNEKRYCLVVKLDQKGEVQWKNYYGSSGLNLGSRVRQIENGYIVTGATDSCDVDIPSNNRDFDSWIFMIDENGKLQWQKCFGGSDYDSVESMQVIKDGGYILGCVTASSDGDVSENYGKVDFCIVKMNSEGIIEWEKSYGGSNYDSLSAIKQTIDGGYIAAGVTGSDDGHVGVNYGIYDGWIIKLDKEGSLQWRKCIGGSEVDSIESLCLSDNYYIFGGFSESAYGLVTGNSGLRDFWIIKMKQK